jgi:hypothetical protein
MPTLHESQRPCLVGELSGKYLAGLDVDADAVEERPGGSATPDGAHLTHAARHQLQRAPRPMQHTCNTCGFLGTRKRANRSEKFFLFYFFILI